MITQFPNFFQVKSGGLYIYFGLDGQESQPCFRDLKKQQTCLYKQFGLQATLLLNEKQNGEEEVDVEGALLIEFVSD